MSEMRNEDGGIEIVDLDVGESLPELSDEFRVQLDWALKKVKSACIDNLESFSAADILTAFALSCEALGMTPDQMSVWKSLSYGQRESIVQEVLFEE